MFFDVSNQNESVSARPLVSTLYPLEPLGLDSPKVECLTSYLSRLSEAHNVHATTLIRTEILPHVREVSQRLHISRTRSMEYSGTLNHCGGPASEMIAMLEQLTWRDDLKFTTLIPWKDRIGTIKLTRQHRAWCPECYRVLVDSHRPLYDQLLWTLNVVSVCPYHGITLLDFCTNCNERVPFLGPVGMCPKCSTKLSTGSADANCVLDETEVEISRQIGELLALSSTPSSLPSRESINFALNRCTAVYFNGSSKLFSQCLGLSASYGNNLLHDYNPVGLSTLVTLSLQTGLPILNLIHNDFAQDVEVCPRKQYGTSYLSELTQSVLRNCARPKSIKELIRKVGISRTTFYKYLPNVGAEFNAWNKGVNPNHIGAPIVIKHQKMPSSELTRIRTELEDLIKNNEGESLPKIALQLNCRLYNIKWHFPEHYMELRQQYLNAKRGVRHRTVKHLQSVLDSDAPTPKLTEIAVQLDVDVNTLRYYDDRLCRQLVQKRKNQRQEERIAPITVSAAPTRESSESILKSALLEYPPPSLSDVQRRAGLSDSSSRTLFPDLVRRISKRSADYISQQRTMRNEEIHDIATQLHTEGIYPSIRCYGEN